MQPKVTRALTLHHRNPPPANLPCESPPPQSPRKDKLLIVTLLRVVGGIDLIGPHALVGGVTALSEGGNVLNLHSF